MSHANDENIEDLIASMDDINAKIPNEEWSLLQYAATLPDSDAIAYLLSQGVTTECLSSSMVVPRVTPLMIAIKYGYMNHIRLLTDKSDVNYQDQYGFSAVHYAVMTRNKEALLHIIENGAKVSIESKNGSTPLDIAEELQYDDIVDILQSRIQVEKDPTTLDFKDWLTSLGAVEFLTKFLDAGYDLSFIAKYGLREEDLNCVGIPTRKLGLRRKLMALHKLGDFYDVQSERSHETEENSRSDDSRWEEDIDGEYSDE